MLYLRRWTVCILSMLVVAATVCADEADDKATAFVQQVGGQVVRLEQLPDKPVVEVILSASSGDGPPTSIRAFFSFRKRLASSLRVKPWVLGRGFRPACRPSIFLQVLLQGAIRIIPSAEVMQLATDFLAPLASWMGRPRKFGVRLGRLVSRGGLSKIAFGNGD
jgi:hypothetical protein